MGTTTVDFTTNFGDIDIVMYDTVAPQTVQNFLNYAENMTIGAGYDETFFHRLATGFVLQGGGYDFINGAPETITAGPPVPNEFSTAHPDVEGTVSMAKLGSDPNSATDEFFFNLADNSSNLDNQDGGFTVFGTVTAASWPVVEAIANLQVVDAGGAFDDLPIQGTIAGGAIAADNLVFITDVTVTTTPACFRRGTRITTIRGEVPVECLVVGDRVASASGSVLPVVWLGHRRVNCRAHPDPASVFPVRVAAGAFAPDMPARDLFLSPDHAVFADDVLIPIKHLINGRTIAQIAIDEVEYWHVELDQHDVLLAEGLATESYLDTGNRSSFATACGPLQLHPDFSPLSWDHACAELVQAGPRVVAVKQRLFERAGPGQRPVPRLQVRAGSRVLPPERLAPATWRYAVPPGVHELRLVSPPWTPAACQAASLDRRSLGVRLFGVAVDDLPPVLDGAPFGPGFHAVEDTAEGACRWTDGCGHLTMPGDTAAVTLCVEDGVVPLAGIHKKKRSASF